MLCELASIPYGIDRLAPARVEAQLARPGRVRETIRGTGDLAHGLSSLAAGGVATVGFVDEQPPPERLAQIGGSLKSHIRELISKVRLRNRRGPRRSVHFRKVDLTVAVFDPLACVSSIHSGNLVHQ